MNITSEIEEDQVRRRRRIVIIIIIIIISTITGINGKIEINRSIAIAKETDMTEAERTIVNK